MSGVASSLLTGAGIGLSVAAPIGPMGMLCIQRTLATGLYTGFATGLGAATAHLAYGGLALLGRAELGGLLQQTALLSLLSGAILMWLSLRLLRRIVIVERRAEDRQSLLSSYCGAVGLGILNPTTPALFATVLPALLGQESAPPALLVGGVFLGSLGWWFALSGSVSLLKDRLTTPALNTTNKVLGVLLAGMAVLMVLRACRALGKM